MIEVDYISNMNVPVERERGIKALAGVVRERYTKWVELRRLRQEVKRIAAQPGPRRIFPTGPPGLPGGHRA